MPNNTATSTATPRRLSGLWLILRETDEGGVNFLGVNPAYDKTGPVPAGTGLYQLVSGACNPGEAPHEAAIRHGFKEIGLTMPPTPTS